MVVFNFGFSMFAVWALASMIGVSCVFVVFSFGVSMFVVLALVSMIRLSWVGCFYFVVSVWLQFGLWFQ